MRGHGRGSDEDRDATDDALVARARHDAEAFGELYDRHVDGIYRFVFARLGSREAAEDVTSEVFLKALRGLAGYRPGPRPFRAWLYRIAANAVVDHIRARRPSAPLEAAGSVASGAAPVDDTVAAQAEAHDVWDAVGRLSEPQRVAFALRYGQDLAIADVADLMGRSEGAVKLLLHRGLHSVRERLEHRGHEESP